MSYTDGAGHFVKGAARYTDAWEVVWANSWQDSGKGINESGDVVGTLGVSAAIRAALYIEALDQVFLIEDLQDPWGFLDAARDINDAGWIAGGHAGAVLLVRTGDMPPPTAPANLTAVPHEPTWQQPWNAITLNWEDTSTLTHGFYVERRVSGTGDWVEIVSNWSNTQLWDTSVDLGVTYDYRVRAKGIGGFSDYSNIATATAPSDPVDTEPPLVVFVTPQDGETVIADIQVVVDVTDNQALNYVEVSAAGQTICSEALGGTTSSTTLDCTWNTAGLPTGWYAIYAYASDAMTSATTESIQVYVQGTGLCDGDGVCTLGEDCLSCPSDCAGQTTGKPDDRWCCGDGECSAAEDGSVCSLDCCTTPPGEVSGVGFDADEVTVYWTPSAPDGVYDVARQNLGGVAAGEPLECLVSGLDTASYSDLDEPAAGTLFCYLVRASNACGAGSWGAASGGEPRTATCP